MRTVRILPLLGLIAPLLAGACGSDDNGGGLIGQAGTGGAAGKAGSGKGGSSGKGGTNAAGSGGSAAGNGGAAGTVSTGGSAGKGGGTNKGGSAGAAGKGGASGATGKGGGPGTGGKGGSSAGSAGASACSATQVDCNKDDSDGCEADLSKDPTRCGGCDTVCPTDPNSTATCTDGACGSVCHVGFEDCDLDAPGCETNVGEDVDHCGACDAAPCPGGLNGVATCSGGKCDLTCVLGFAECDKDPANGCETPTLADTANCGSCGNKCDEGTKCVGGACECAATSVAAKLLPVDLFVMLDQSQSMDGQISGGKTRWTAVKEALTGFVSDAKSAGIGVGIQYFPRTDSPSTPNLCSTNAQCGARGPCATTKVCDKPFGGGYQFCEDDDICTGYAGGSCRPVGNCSGNGNICFGDAAKPCPGSQTCLLDRRCTGKFCSVGDYATPDVAITELPAGATAITTSLNAHSPTGATPTGPALLGAIEYATKWATDHPDHVTAVVLATDGLPTTCSPQNVDDIAVIAGNAAAGSPKVLTFVIGVFGAEDAALAQKNLDTIAAKGGGQPKATIITTGSDVTAQFQAALESVSKSAIGCEYQIPAPAAGATVDFSKVNVILTTATGNPETLKGVGDAASCAGGEGWSYDDPAAPKKITLCPTSCTKAQSGANAKVDISLGCSTRKD